MRQPYLHVFDAGPRSPDTVKLERTRITAKLARRRHPATRAASPPPSYNFDALFNDEAQHRPAAATSSAARLSAKERARRRQTRSAARRGANRRFASAYLTAGRTPRAATARSPSARRQRRGDDDDDASVASERDAFRAQLEARIARASAEQSGGAGDESMSLRDLAAMSAGGALLPELVLWHRRQRGGTRVKSVEIDAALMPSLERQDVLDFAVRTLPKRFLPATMRDDLGDSDDPRRLRIPASDPVHANDVRLLTRLEEAMKAHHNDELRLMQRGVMRTSVDGSSARSTPRRRRRLSETTAAATAESRRLYPFSVGDDVEANYRGEGRWYTAKVTGFSADVSNGFVVELQYDDGDVEASVPTTRVRVLRPGTPGTPKVASAAAAPGSADPDASAPESDEALLPPSSSALALQVAASLDAAAAVDADAESEATTLAVVAELRTARREWRRRLRGRKRRVLHIDAVRSARELHWWAVRRRAVERCTFLFNRWRGFNDRRLAMRRNARPMLMRLIAVTGLPFEERLARVVSIRRGILPSATRELSGQDHRKIALGFATWKYRIRAAVKAERIQKEAIFAMMGAIRPTGIAFRTWRFVMINDVWNDAIDVASAAATHAAVVAHSVGLYVKKSAALTHGTFAAAAARAAALAARRGSNEGRRAAVQCHAAVVCKIAKAASRAAIVSNRWARRYVYRAMTAQRAVDFAAQAGAFATRAAAHAAVAVAHDGAYAAEWRARTAKTFVARIAAATTARKASDAAAIVACVAAQAVAHCAARRACDSAAFFAARAAVCAAKVCARKAASASADMILSLRRNGNTARRNYSRNALRAADVAIGIAMSGAKAVLALLPGVAVLVKNVEHTVGVRAAVMTCALRPDTESNKNLNCVAELVANMLEDGAYDYDSNMIFAGVLVCSFRPLTPPHAPPHSDAHARYEWKLIDLNNDGRVSEGEFIVWVHDRFSHLKGLPILALKFAFRFTITAEACVAHGADLGLFERLYVRTQETINHTPDAPSELPRRLFKILLRNIVHFFALWLVFCDFTERCFSEIKNRKKRKAARLHGRSFTRDDFRRYLEFVIGEAVRTGGVESGALGRVVPDMSMVQQLKKKSSIPTKVVEGGAEEDVQFQVQHELALVEERAGASREILESLRSTGGMEREFERMDTLTPDDRIDFAEFANWFDAVFPELHTMVGMHRSGVEKIKGWNLLHIGKTLQIGTEPMRRVSSEFIDVRGRRRSVYLIDELRVEKKRKATFMEQIQAYLDRSLLIDLVVTKNSGEKGGRGGGGTREWSGNSLHCPPLTIEVPKLQPLGAIGEGDEIDSDEDSGDEDDEVISSPRSPMRPSPKVETELVVRRRGSLSPRMKAKVKFGGAAVLILLLEKVFVPKVRRYLARRMAATRCLQRRQRGRTMRGADGDALELSNAVKQGNTIKVMRLLRSATAEVAAKLVEEVDSSGATPLLHAAWEGDPQIVRLLLNAGADVNAATRRGNTALHFVCERGNAECCQILLDAGAVEKLNSVGRLPNVNLCLGGQAISASGVGDRGANSSARRGTYHGTYSQSEAVRLRITGRMSG